MKKLFNIIALSLAFAPALHGDVVHERVNALKQQIDAADAQTFEKSYTAFLESDVTLQDRKNALAMLERYAHKTKLQIQDELANMGDATTNKTMLASGIFGAFFGTFFGIGAIGALNYAIKNPISSLIEESWHSTYAFPVAYTMSPYIVYGLCLLTVGEKLGLVHSATDDESPAAKCVALALVTGGAALSYFLLKYSLQNIKKGWDYKKYLEQQVAKLDEIIVYIQQMKESPA